MTVSDAQMRAIRKYSDKTYDQLILRLRKDSDLNGEALRLHAESQDESINEFIQRAIRLTIQTDTTLKGN